MNRVTFFSTCPVEAVAPGMGDEPGDLMSDDVLDGAASGATRIVGCDVSRAMHLEGRRRH